MLSTRRSSRRGNALVKLEELLTCASTVPDSDDGVTFKYTQNARAGKPASGNWLQSSQLRRRRKPVTDVASFRSSVALRGRQWRQQIQRL